MKKAGSSVALTSSTKNANLNADVTFTAVVTSATTGTPSGSVEFMDGTKELGTSTLNGTGSATYTTSKLTAGLHQITAVYSGNGNFDGSTSAALAEIVTAPNYSLTSNPSSLTLKAGQTGKATISLVPVGGFKGTVQLSCNGLPSEAHCTFSPSALTADGSNTTETSTLTITTVGPYSGTVGSVAMLHPGNPDGEMLAGIFWLPGLLFGLFLMWQRKRLTTKYRVLVLMLLVATTLSGMVGCGFQQPMTGPGTNSYLVGSAEVAVVDPGPDGGRPQKGAEALLGPGGQGQADPQPGRLKPVGHGQRFGHRHTEARRQRLGGDDRCRGEQVDRPGACRAPPGQ